MEEGQVTSVQQGPASKKPRLVFTDLQRRTLQAIFKVNIKKMAFKRHSTLAKYIVDLYK